MIDIQINKQQIDRLQAALKDTKQTVQREVATAINATGKFVSREINKEIRSELVVQKKAVDKVIKIRGRASANKLGLTVELEKSERIPLRDFGSRKTTTGVSYKISKREGRKQIRSAFQVQKFGKRVFLRRGKTRLPIDQKYGPSPWGVMIVDKRRIEKIIHAGELELEKQVERRIRFRSLQRQGTI